MSQVAVVSHDAGGAEILSSWLNHNSPNASVAVSGPAELIFSRKCPQIKFLTLNEALYKCTWLLCSIGWQSTFERFAIARGRSLGKKTVVFLDHWVNYRERFEDGYCSVLPDEIWVGDSDAERIARSQFIETPILLKPNPYFEDLRAEFSRVQTSEHRSATNRVLYVCEPVADHALRQHGDERYWGYTENDALSYFISNISALGQPISSITIRPHPSEHPTKYNWVSSLCPYPIKFSREKKLTEEVLESELVVGCESMAMVVGLLAGRRVISAIPPGGRPCQLPQRDIEHLQQLIRLPYRHE